VGGGARRWGLKNKCRVTNKFSQTTLEPCGLRNQQLFPNEVSFLSCEPPAENSLRVHASMKYK
jgi:hypothetical protein